MVIGSPPSQLDTPNPLILQKNDIVHRIHNHLYFGNSFNLGLGSPTRFAPLYDRNGLSVPTLYAPETLESALFETIFHGRNLKSKISSVPLYVVQLVSHSLLQLKRSIKLASLRESDLRKWGIRRSDLITTSPKFYHISAQWAEAIHNQFYDIEGLVWTSNQCDPYTAYLFFDDRVFSEDFNILSTRKASTDPTVLMDARKAGKRSAIRITT
ncbi:MAG: RES family NAD+ phosphorylase [Bacteroidetes bacterium]|nr:RES family NAD+ phosphorylase [Bacteroidota bacterium]